MEPPEKDDEIQLKSMKRLDNETPEYNGGKSPDDQPSYKKTIEEGKINPTFTRDDDDPGTLNQGTVDTVVITTTEPVMNGDGVRHRANGEPKMQLDEVEQYEESSDDDDDDSGNKVIRHVTAGRNAIVLVLQDHGKEAKAAIWTIIGILYIVYFAFAMTNFDSDDEGDVRLLWVTVVVAVFIVFHFLRKHCCADFDLGKTIDWESERALKIRNILYWCLVVVVALFIVIFVIADVAVKRPENLISALGMLVFVLVFYIFSYNPAKVKFRPVFWGLALQFIFALLILRTKWGFSAFQWLGARVSEFLAHTDAGSAFVFGDDLVFGSDYMFSVFAFKVLTIIVFFSSIISVLYYLGVMQFVIRVIARFLAFCLGTSPTESLNAAGNIFIGQSESPLMIRPFLKDMTRSELHAVCTGGFATIAGSVLGAYISMGIPANHLLSASVMSAPAALAMAKLLWPETKKTKSRAKDVYNMPKGSEHNFIEAASNGASTAISLIANVAVNLIAFIAILEFINKTLTWFGHRLGQDDPEITFPWICSYVFVPLAWLMGVSGIRELRTVARLVGVKTFLNEFVAYDQLSSIIANTRMYDEWVRNETGLYNGTTYTNEDIILNNGTILYNGILSDRSTVIATYALCGFSNIGSIGIMLGSLGAMAPSRKKDITKVVVRAMIAGNVACFMTACIAGLLYEGPA